jgi:hypothetical protein
MRLRDRFNRKTRTPSTTTQRIGFAFFWLIVLSYAFFVASDANWNTESHLYPAFSAVDHHTLQIDAYRGRLGDISSWGGHYYSDKAPGLSLLAIPVYGALRVAMPSQKGQPYEAYPHLKYAIPRATVYLRYAITYVLIILPSAAFAVLFWLFAARFLARGWALLLAAVYALGTLAYPFSVRFYSHQLAAVLLFSAFMLIFLRVRRRLLDRNAVLAAATAGTLCGYSVISEYPTAVIAALILAYLATVASRRPYACAAYLAGMVPAAVLGLGYNLLAFGRPLATGYMYTHSALYQSHARATVLGLTGLASYGLQLPTPDSLWQITFGAYRGLFVVSPVLLLFAVAVPLTWRRRDLRVECVLCVAVVAAYFLLDASHGAITDGWSGGSSVASRHLVPALPFMCLPLAFGLSSRRFRLAFVALGSLSMAIMFMTVSSVGVFSMTDRNPLVHELVPTFFGGNIQPNWGNMLGLTGFGGLGVFALVAAVLTARIVWLLRETPAAVPFVDRLAPKLETP